MCVYLSVCVCVLRQSYRVKVCVCGCVCSSSDSGLIKILRRGVDGVWNRAVTKQHPPGIRDREGCVSYLREVQGGMRGVRR